MRWKLLLLWLLAASALHTQPGGGGGLDIGGLYGRGPTGQLVRLDSGLVQVRLLALGDAAARPAPGRTTSGPGCTGRPGNCPRP